MKVILLGAGDVGDYLAGEFSGAGNEVTVIDTSGAQLANTEDDTDVLALRGDCTHRSVLSAAKTKDADLVIAVTGSDHTNLLAAALAADMGAQLTVARVDDPKFYLAPSGVERGLLGTHALLCASRLVSEELLRQVVHIGARFAGNFAAGHYQVVTFALGADAALLGKAASAVKLPASVALAAVLRDAVLRPPAEISALELDDELLLAGPRWDLFKVLRQLDARGGRRAVIVGGGDVGIQLATALAPVERRVQLFELKRERCELLAQDLQNVNIIHGDGTSIDHLKDERVGSADYVLSVTRRDEVNLMVSLMAKDLGVQSALALVHRPGYADTYAHLGLTATAGTHQVIKHAIDRLLPRDGILSVQRLPGTGYALFEVQLPPLSKKLFLADFMLSRDALCVGWVRGGQVLSLTQHQPLQGDDRLLLSAPIGARSQLVQRLRELRKGKP